MREEFKINKQINKQTYTKGGQEDYLIGKGRFSGRHVGTVPTGQGCQISVNLKDPSLVRLMGVELLLACTSMHSINHIRL